MELPRKSGTGYLTTVEGLIERILSDMKQMRNSEDLTLDDTYVSRLDFIISKLELYINAGEEFVVVVDDVTGNSFVENLYLQSSSNLFCHFL